MSALKVVTLFLEQRVEVQELRLELGRYRNENPVLLDVKLAELHQIMDAIEVIDKASRE